MEKISKSKTPKHRMADDEGDELELEPDGDGGLLLSLRDKAGAHADAGTWECFTFTRETWAEFVKAGEALFGR
ncbi:MAG: hypothetical protein VYE22_04665 [Myxococcota bacterium]|nr:hypothetical protein [Myxococcota bacterium]